MFEFGTFRNQFREIFMSDVDLTRDDKFNIVYFTACNYMARAKVDRRLVKFLTKYKVYFEYGISSYVLDETVEEIMVDLDRALRKKPITPFDSIKFKDFLEVCKCKVNKRIAEFYNNLPEFPQNMTVDFNFEDALFMRSIEIRKGKDINH